MASGSSVSDATYSKLPNSVSCSSSLPSVNSFKKYSSVPAYLMPLVIIVLASIIAAGFSAAFSASLRILSCSFSHSASFSCAEANSLDNIMERSLLINKSFLSISFTPFCMKHSHRYTTHIVNYLVPCRHYQRV